MTEGRLKLTQQPMLAVSYSDGTVLALSFDTTWQRAMHVDSLLKNGAPRELRYYTRPAPAMIGEVP